MNWLKVPSFFALNFLTVLQLAHAQSSCDKLLEHGIYDYWRENTSQSNSSQIDSQLCQAYNQYRAGTLTADATGHYGIAGGSISMTREDIESIASSSCGGSHNALDYKAIVQRNSQVISKPALDAWNQCNDNNRDGLLVDTLFLNEDVGSTGLTIGMRYQAPPGTHNATVHLSRIETEGSLSCSGPLIDKLQQNPNGIDLDNAVESFTCTRPISAIPFSYGQYSVMAVPGNVIIYTTNKNILRTLSKVPVFPPPITYGIGDIIASILDLAKFQSVHGQGWILADGTPVRNSIYAALSGKDSVPDLRGRFLRGYNNGRSIADGDTLGDRFGPGDKEPDDVGPHKHSISNVIAMGAAAPGFTINTGGPSFQVVKETGEVFTTNAIQNLETRPRSVIVNYYIKIN